MSTHNSTWSRGQRAAARLLALFIGVSLALAACGGDDESPDPVADPPDLAQPDPTPTADAPDPLLSDPTDVVVETAPLVEAGTDLLTAVQVCEALSGEPRAELDGLCGGDGELRAALVQNARFELCPGDLRPRMFVPLERMDERGSPDLDQPRRLAFSQEMIIRFHPADTFDPQMTHGMYSPAAALGTHTLLEDHRVWIIDQAEHGMFISDVIATLLGMPGPVKPHEVPPGPLADTEFDNLADDLIVNLDIGGATPGVTTEADLVRVLTNIAENKTLKHDGMIINLSLGASNCGEPPQALLDVMKVLEGLNVEFVASAGNSESSDPVYPAAWGVAELADSLTSVGAVDLEDDSRRACFSNYGDWVEGWMVGVEVLANNGSELGTWSGTSFAAPQATAMIAAGQPVPTATPDPPPDTYDVSLANGPDGRANTADDERWNTYCPPMRPADLDYLPGDLIYWNGEG